jgi:hypothetical protein
VGHHQLPRVTELTAGGRAQSQETSFDSAKFGGQVSSSPRGSAAAAAALKVAEHALGLKSPHAPR